MLSEKTKALVSNATVGLPRLGGRGVLVKGNLIVTAAHCINFKSDGSLLMIDRFSPHSIDFVEEIETVGGKLKVVPWAVEPVHDIAVLGPLDGQAFYDEVLGFDRFCKKVKPLTLFLDTLKYYQKFPIFIYTHNKTWTGGEAINWSIEKDHPMINIRTDCDIEGGTSGSPIVNEKGKLVAIVSNAEGFKGNCRKGTAPRPHLALPLWISRFIRRGDFRYQVPTNEEAEIIKKSMIDERKQEVNKAVCG